MKLLSLNLWGGRQDKILFDYLLSHQNTTDIFCFQEVFTSKTGTPKTHQGNKLFLYEDLIAYLPNFSPYFEAKSYGYADDGPEKSPWDVSHGIAMFVRKSLPVKNYQVKIVGDAAGNGAPLIEGTINVQALTLSLGQTDLHIINIHGMSYPGTKLDTPVRLEQSRQLVDLVNSLPKGPLILCGDFNLMPETQSIKMLESAGLSNLIKDYKITNTRNKISWQDHNNIQYFADYTFVSSQVTVNSFEVPYNEVSDHLPMILEFEIL